MKKFMFFIVLFSFSCLVYADVCIDGSDSCGEPDDEVCIPAEIMDEIKASNQALRRFPRHRVSANINNGNAGVVPFEVTISDAEGNPQKYTVYSLTNYVDEQGHVHDLVSSIKIQGSSGDCTRFASTGAIEIKLAKQYADIFQTAKNVVSTNRGNPGIVEANLSEAYAKEIAGCENHGTNVMIRLAARGIIQEEHYPYYVRSFGEFEYLSKRDTERYGDFYNKGCNKENSWNSGLREKAKDEQWLRFYPGFPETTTEINDVKDSIQIGEPIVMTYRYDCMFDSDDKIAPGSWGKFTNFIVKDNRAIEGGGGHAVIIVGYMEPVDTGTGPDYFIIKNSHYFESKLELFTVDQNFAKNCNPEYNIFGGDVKIFTEGSESSLVLEVLTEVENLLEHAQTPEDRERWQNLLNDLQDLRNFEKDGDPGQKTYLSADNLVKIDFDQDAIPDIFDNSVYSKIYAPADLADVSHNPAQGSADGDRFPLERDGCPYRSDHALWNMDMDNFGDFCDKDIDGDGISNVEEGLSDEYLYRVYERLVSTDSSLSIEEYAVVNPFIDGKTGKISGKYFVSEKFVEGKTEELILTDKYISGIDFYLLPFHDNIESTPKFQFIKNASFFHNWYLSLKAKETDPWIRKFSYKDDNKMEQVSYGLKWNIPGLFEMKDIPYRDYKDDNYGENYPENFNNCLLHCEQLVKRYAGQDFLKLEDCQQACRNAYQCTEGEGIDRDCDGIRNDYDKCPDTYNPEQLDSDGDGVPDACDNCPGIPNPLVSRELKSEFILAEDFGAYAQGLCKIEDDSKFPRRPVCMMQPDSDLDGIGDACDFMDPNQPLKIQKKLGFANSRITNIQPHSFTMNYFFQEFDDYANVRLNMPENSGRGLDVCKPSYRKNDIECNASVHYCAINHIDKTRDWWGTRGHCSTAEKEGGSSVSGKNFGYSHGSDDFSDDSILSWQHRISFADSSKFTKSYNWKDSFNGAALNNSPARKPVKVPTTGETVIWNWRRDWYEFNGCVKDSTQPICQNILHGGDYNVENTMYYALSTSILPVKDGSKLEEIPSYIKYGDNGEPEINNDYFPSTNKNKFARAARYNIDVLELNYHTKMITPPVSAPIEFPDIELCASCYFDMPIRYFGINEIQPYEYVSRYEIRKDSENKVLLDSQRIMFHKDQIAFSEISPKEMIGIETNGKEYFLTINTSESGADWSRIGRIENWDPEIGEIESFSANYFIAKNANGVKTLYSLELISEIPQNFDAFIDDGELPEMVYTVNNLGEIGFDHELTKLVFANGMLYLFANSGNGFGTYLHNGRIFEEIQGLMPQQRKIVNVSVSGRYLFLAGGTDFNNETMNDLWRFDTETNSWEQIPVTLQGDFSKVIMQEAGGKIVGFNPIIDDNTTFPVFEFENLEDVENIEVSYSQIKIENLDFEQTFCIAESDNTIFPGITNFYGECVKVENYDFNEVTFPDYKLSVAGYKNSLYLGGLTGIRRVEIGETGEITKKEMTYSGKANNLAVYGNTLYAANYSEIDIFEIAEDGSISRKSSVKTSNCKNIRIDGGKLFAAENKRVRIFDLNDPRSPNLLKTISFSNTVEDLETAAGKLFVYENLNGLLTRKGKVSVFDISDIATPQKIKEFSQYCNDPEMQKSGNSVYLGCKNGSFKVEETGLQKMNGSKNYLREGYVYDGILYQVFSGTLHLSSLKTEEIQEDGWL